MSEIVEILSKDLDRRDKEFLRQLKATGNPELALCYDKIIAVRKTVEVYKQEEAAGEKVRPVQPSLPVETSDASQKESSDTDQTREESNGDFKMSEAVTEVIKGFGGTRFGFADVFEALKQNYPADVDDDKRGSASATVSNFKNAGKIRKLEEDSTSRKAVYVEGDL